MSAEKTFAGKRPYTPNSVWQVGAGRRGTALGQQNNVIPRRLAPNPARNNVVRQRQDVFPPVPPLRLVPELELLP
ncbi:MAG TPA: hypothetical protein EYH05_16535 [Anaerolineae bacterium]|nr:hypothetical protein [Anaerolineae bacterium]